MANSNQKLSTSKTAAQLSKKISSAVIGTKGKKSSGKPTSKLSGIEGLISRLKISESGLEKNFRKYVSKNPILFAAGALVAGLIASKVFKKSPGEIVAYTSKVL